MFSYHQWLSSLCFIIIVLLFILYSFRFSDRFRFCHWFIFHLAYMVTVTRFIIICFPSPFIFDIIFLAVANFKHHWFC